MKDEPNAKSSSTKIIVDKFYEALFARDFERLAGLFAEEADWDVPGNERLAPWLGKRRTRREIKDFFETLAENVEPLSAEIEQILVDGESAVATGEFASRMIVTGKIFESIFSAHFTVRDERIVRYRLLEDSFGLVEALTAEEKSEVAESQADVPPENQKAAFACEPKGFLNKGFFREVFGGTW